MKPSLYTPRHYLGVAAHYTAVAGLFATAVVLAQPWVIGVAAVVVGGAQYAGIRLNKNFFENKLKKHDDIHEHSPRLGEIARELYTKSGLKAGDFPIYDFKADAAKMQSGKTGAFDRLFEAAMNQAALTPNAAAVNIGKPIIMISTPLLKMLGDEEEKAVLAHEFAHAAARHHYVKMPLSFMMGTAGMALALTSIGAFFSAGLVGVLAGVGAGIVAGIGGGLAYAAATGQIKKLMNKNKADMTPKELAAKKQVNGASKLSGLTARVGVVSMFNPAYLAVFAAARAVAIANQLVAKRFSRHHEFQADRGAVALGADPLALITALRKITTISERSIKATYGEDALPKKGYLTKAWKKATATHPELDQRIARLSKMAKKQNATTEAIDQAVKGDLGLDDSHLMHPEVIRAMVAR